MLYKEETCSCQAHFRDVSLSRMYLNRCVGSHHEWQVLLDLSSLKGEREYVFITSGKSVVLLRDLSTFI